jgi:hypothetical protein
VNALHPAIHPRFVKLFAQKMGARTSAFTHLFDAPSRLPGLQSFFSHKS